jgi:hypothetical protein
MTWRINWSLIKFSAAYEKNCFDGIPQIEIKMVYADAD